jgi:DNA-binding CsgD family transcriptional regulator
LTTGAGRRRGVPIASQLWASLTDVQRSVADLIAEGLTNLEIAGELRLSRHTIDFHLREIFRKLGIQSRAELIRVVERLRRDS